MTFGEKLQALRKSRGWTQEQLSEQIHISRQTLSKWEQGSVLPDTEYVLSISRLFQVSTDYLLRDEYDRPEQPLEKDPKGARGDFSWLLWVLPGSLGAGVGLLGPCFPPFTPSRRRAWSGSGSTRACGVF